MPWNPLPVSTVCFSDHNDLFEDGYITQARIPKLCMELLEMPWGCKRLGYETRCASSPLPGKREGN